MAKKGSIFKYKNPVSGASGDLANIGENKENILGVAVLFGFFAIGKMALNWAGVNLFRGRVKTTGSLISNQGQEEKTPVTKILV